MAHLSFAAEARSDAERMKFTRGIGGGVVSVGKLIAYALRAAERSEERAEFLVSCE